MQQLNFITSSNKTIMYDQYCKMLIGHPYMLARIISYFVEEAKYLSLDEIKKLIKGVRIGDKIGNPHFYLMDKEAFIKDEGLMCYDIYFYIDLPQIDQSTKRVYINIEIQNNPYTKYHLVTRSIAYSSRMISSQWGREYDSENYDGMKKTYVIWILPQAAKKRDGHVNCINSKLENISGSTIERLESYDKSEQIMIYLNKDHDIKDKYEDSDWIKTPLVIFLNNTYDLLIKKEVMKEYGFEEIEKEVKKMCNLGEMIARENIEKGHSMGLEQGLVQGQKLERIASIKNLMKKIRNEKIFSILKERAPTRSFVY